MSVRVPFRKEKPFQTFGAERDLTKGMGLHNCGEGWKGRLQTEPSALTPRTTEQLTKVGHYYLDQSWGVLSYECADINTIQGSGSCLH